jgi:diguanylate cyclase (GGDEF)-like protein/PAS domain S-box-containing protein
MRQDQIFIVEDEGITAMHLRALLAGIGYNVTGIEDTAEGALDRIAETPPDLVLMDIRLKGTMDGVTAGHLIRGRYGIPVVFLSAHNDEGTLQRVKASRAYGFVVKPFVEQDVAMAVASALFRHRIESVLAESEDPSTMTLGEGGTPQIATDPVGRIMYVNRAAEQLLGWKQGDVFARSAAEVLPCRGAGGEHVDDHPVARAIQDGAVATTEPDTVLLARDGSGISVTCRAEPVHSSSGQQIGVIISLRRRREGSDLGQRSSHQVQHDPLTGFANRSLLVDQLADAVARAQHNSTLVAVLLLDIDRFADVNRSLGPTLADRLLEAIPARIRNCVRRSDLLARAGDDEFAIIQQDLENIDGVAALAEKLVGVFSEPFAFESIAINVTASVGVAVYPLDGEHPDPLITKAEEALNKAKEAGRNQFQMCGGEVEELVASRENLEEDIRMAMDRDQLKVLCQPIFDLASREVTGAEAVLQWLHPERGPLPASRFLKLADRGGMLTPITDWLVLEALSWAAKWQSIAPGIRISVNITGPQLRRRDLVPTVIHALRDSALEARHLDLEIREDLLIRQPPINARLNMERLRQLGVSLTLDHFGFAYASMMSLKKLPLSRIKIDGSLVAAVTRDPEVQAIVQATVDLARRSRLEVVADGIETEEQLRWLRFHGCHYGQGGFLAPLVAAELGPSGFFRSGSS